MDGTSETMMHLSDLEKERFSATKAASDQARPLALAGIAIVWLFAGPFFRDAKGSEAHAPPGVLILAAGAFSVSLALDLMQLAIRAVMLDAIYSDREASDAAQEAIRNGTDPQVQELGSSLATITRWFWGLKLVALVLGYFCVVGFFVARLVVG